MLNCLTGFSSAAERPNILLIVVDDQSPFDLKVYNPDSKCETPNIDRLAREGMTLDAAYQMGSWSGAVCTPSRHMIMSGRTVWHLPKRQRRNKNKQNNDPNPNLAPEELADYTMAAVFNKAGYDTIFVSLEPHRHHGQHECILINRR